MAAPRMSSGVGEGECGEGGVGAGQAGQYQLAVVVSPVDGGEVFPADAPPARRGLGCWVVERPGGGDRARGAVGSVRSGEDPLARLNEGP